jgi:hypothetical protein
MVVVAVEVALVVLVVLVDLVVVVTVHILAVEDFPVDCIYIQILHRKFVSVPDCEILKISLCL